MESDPHSLAQHARALQAAGIETHTLDDPMQLLSAVDRLDPELLLRGLQLAQADGAELAAILRERDHERHLPIVFLAEAGTPRGALDAPRGRWRRPAGEAGRHAWNLYETEWDVEVRNHKKEDTEVTIMEPVPGDWEVVKSSHPYTKVEAHTLQYAVKVPKDGKVTVNYRVRMRW